MGGGPSVPVHGASAPVVGASAPPPPPPGVSPPAEHPPGLSDVQVSFLDYVCTQMKLKPGESLNIPMTHVGNSGVMLGLIKKRLNIGVIEHVGDVIAKGSYGSIYYKTDAKQRVIKVINDTNVDQYILESLIQLFISFSFKKILSF